MVISYYSSPIGMMKIISDGEYITNIHFVELFEETILDTLHAMCHEQLTQYFNGERTTFTIPTKQKGTAFQQSVWKALTEISYGETRTYGQLAVQLGSKDVVRAVGAANGQNKIPILIPCHRVIGHDGKLVGFAYGIERKRYLLEHEKMTSSVTTQLSLY